jgi:ABC-type antimicrobial peptide transport system permease subunit
MTIVGLVADVIDAGLHRLPRPILYFPYRQIEQFHLLGNMSLVVKAHLPVNGLISSVRSVVQEADPGQAVYDVQTMDQIVSESLSGRRFVSWLFGSFATIALVLALAGVYGVISYLVARRTNEFGIRVALGASPRAVLCEVLGSGILLVGIGLTLGIVGALAVTRILSGMLFGVTPTDVPTYILVSALLTAVALTACAIPARRAMMVDPVEALRYE